LLADEACEGYRRFRDFALVPRAFGARARGSTARPVWPLMCLSHLFRKNSVPIQNGLISHLCDRKGILDGFDQSVRW